MEDDDVVDAEEVAPLDAQRAEAETHGQEGEERRTEFDRGHWDLLPEAGS
jgi:hypothetical protein